MKLYYAPGACSLAAHIALQESAIPFELARVDLRQHVVGSGTDFYTINPKGYVPVLELDDGQRLTEVAVILQYIADRNPGTLAPAFGSVSRYRLMEWLNFIATEIHKGLGPLWKPTTPDAYKAVVLDAVGARFDHVVNALGTKPYLTGDAFTIADAPLHDRELASLPQVRHRPLARAAALPGTRCRTSAGKEGARGRTSAESRLTSPLQIVTRSAHTTPPRGVNAKRRMSVS